MTQEQKARLEVLKAQAVRNPAEEKEFQALNTQADSEDGSNSSNPSIAR